MSFKRLTLAGALAIAVGSVVIAPAVARSSAVPARTVEWENCSATFVRSSSEIINETERECDPVQNPWTSEDVWLQFRLVDGKPNAACDPTGQVTDTFQFSTTDPDLTGYFRNGEIYNACVYLVDPVVAEGQLDSSDSDGINVDLPTGLDGRYRIDVAGTWQNGSWWLVDAEYVQQMDQGGPNGTTLVWLQGWPGLGDGFGDVLVDGTDVNWGALNEAAHTYSVETVVTAANGIDLAVSDTFHGDNVGSPTYTITYLGQS